MTLLAVSISAGSVLSAWINVFAKHSGAHFNPAVTLAFCVAGKLKWKAGFGCMIVQLLGAAGGVCLATSCSVDLFHSRVHRNERASRIGPVKRLRPSGLS